MSSWLVANGAGTKFRSLDRGIPTWVEDPEQALQFARRADAEKFAEEDEDAWLILAHFPAGSLTDTAANRIKELQAANNQYQDRYRRAEAALENIARWKFPHWGLETTHLELIEAVFGLMNYASAAKAGIFNAQDYKVGEQPVNINVMLMDISELLAK